jgi:hypothetical protein
LAEAIEREGLGLGQELGRGVGGGGLGEGGVGGVAPGAGRGPRQRGQLAQLARELGVAGLGRGQDRERAIGRALPVQPDLGEVAATAGPRHRVGATLEGGPGGVEERAIAGGGAVAEAQARGQRVAIGQLEG